MRPQYHYAAAANWLSDPNGLIWHAGEWHLFYQYNPKGEAWGHMSWGHAVSRDLAVWEELPVALAEDPQGAVFSGSAVIDRTGSAGFGADAPGDVWECPLLIELPVEGEGASRWLFKVDALRGAPGSGAIYRTGMFDGTRFNADPGPWQAADWGGDFYAAIAWHEPRDPAGRPLWIGWLGNHAYQGQLPLKGWRGAMSLPRRISLRRSGARYRLRQEVAAEAVVDFPAASLAQTAIGQSAQLELPGGQDFALRIADRDGRMMLSERRESVVLVTRRDPAAPYLDTVQQVQIACPLPLHLWLDVGSLELLAEEGCLALSLQHQLQGAELSLSFALTSQGDLPPL